MMVALLRILQVFYAVVLLAAAGAYWRPMDIGQQLYLISVVLSLLIMPIIPDSLLKNFITRILSFVAILFAVFMHLFQIYNDVTMPNEADVFAGLFRAFGLTLILAGLVRISSRSSY